MHYEFPSVQLSCNYACAWRHTAALQGTNRTKLRLAHSRSMWRGQRWRRMSRSLCRTVCTVSLLLPQLHSTELNEILRLDFLYIGLSREGKYHYLLPLMDDVSGYLWLEPCHTANSAATVDALMRCFAAIGVVLL
jgi:hypothetical protein